MIARVAAILALLVATEALPAAPTPPPRTPPTPPPRTPPTPPTPPPRTRTRTGDRAASAIKYSNKPNSGDGAYRYEFELPDGQLRYEEGALQNAGMPGKEFLLVRGIFSRPSFDGKGMEQVMYFADEGGFHVVKKAPQLGQGPSAGLLASLVG